MARSLKKGFFVDPKLMDKVSACVQSGDKRPIQTWSRRSTITPDFIGLNFNVHNGKSFLPVYVTENWVSLLRPVRLKPITRIREKPDESTSFSEECSYFAA